MARRRFQQGQLFLRGKKKKVWVGRWREDVIEEDGFRRRIFKSVILGTLEELPTKRLAQRELEEKLVAVNNIYACPKINVTFGQFVFRWEELVLKLHKPSTQASVKQHLKKWLLPKFGDVVLDDIRPEHLQHWVLQVPLKPKTVRNIVASFRMVWKSAKDWSYVKHNALEGVRTPSLGEQHRPFFTQEQMISIIQETKTQPYKLIMALAAETGMRIGEIIGLRVKDIDFEKQFLHIRQSCWQGHITTPKTRNGIRKLGMSDDLVPLLKDFLANHWQDNPNNLLFCTKTGKPLESNNINHLGLHPVLRKLGISQCGMHAFRHGNATLLNALEFPVRTIAERLGHGSLQTTMFVYTHETDERSRMVGQRVAEQIRATLNSNAPTFAGTA